MHSKGRFKDETICMLVTPYGFIHICAQDNLISHLEKSYA
uniref:Uncharacterized protein n=1 Tax=Anguilla anguilla TaxID=7936 RepID=A0A0E9SIT1_ANGAN